MKKVYGLLIVSLMFMFLAALSSQQCWLASHRPDSFHPGRFALFMIMAIQYVAAWVSIYAGWKFTRLTFSAVKSRYLTIYVWLSLTLTPGSIILAYLYPIGLGNWIAFGLSAIWMLAITFLYWLADDGLADPSITQGDFS